MGAGGCLGLARCAADHKAGSHAMDNPYRFSSSAPGTLLTAPHAGTVWEEGVRHPRVPTSKVLGRFPRPSGSASALFPVPWCSRCRPEAGGTMRAIGNQARVTES